MGLCNWEISINPTTSDGLPPMTQQVKNLPAMQEMQETWVGKIPWSRKWQPTPVFLPGESYGQRNLVGYSPRGHKESDMTEWLSMHTLQHPGLWPWPHPWWLGSNEANCGPGPQVWKRVTENDRLGLLDLIRILHESHPRRLSHSGELFLIMPPLIHAVGSWT